MIDLELLTQYFKPPFKLLNNVIYSHDGYKILEVKGFNRLNGGQHTDRLDRTAANEAQLSIAKSIVALLNSATQ